MFLGSSLGELLRYAPASKKQLFGECLRFLLSGQGLVIFLYPVSFVALSYPVRQHEVTFS